MSVKFNYNDNVIFDVYSHTYNANSRMNVIDSSASLSKVRGHLQDIRQDVQSLRETVVPGEKGVKYKLIVRSDSDVDAQVKEGRLIRVTRTKNKYTRKWVALFTVRDYRIVKLNNLDADGRYIVASLTDEGSSAPRT